MKGNSADQRHHETLRRIVALLLALASLAERAACRSWPVRRVVLWLLRWPVRRVVLWLLRPAEQAARVFAAQAGCATSPLFPAERLAHDPGGAARLASQFRTLAAAFTALIHQVSASLEVARRPDPGRRHLGRPHAAWLYRLLLALQPRCADTS